MSSRVNIKEILADPEQRKHLMQFLEESILGAVAMGGGPHEVREPLVERTVDQQTDLGLLRTYYLKPGSPAFLENSFVDWLKALNFIALPPNPTSAVISVQSISTVGEPNNDGSRTYYIERALMMVHPGKPNHHPEAEASYCANWEGGADSICNEQDCKTCGLWRDKRTEVAEPGTMEIGEAIRHAQEKSRTGPGCGLAQHKCASEHAQLALWLRELITLRSSVAGYVKLVRDIANGCIDNPAKWCKSYLEHEGFSEDEIREGDDDE